MADRLSKVRRSWNMSRIKGKNSGPEKIVRTMLHRMGYRFRLHGKKLPGRPDIVLPKHKTVVFVHGCFWHRHRGCKNATVPKTRRTWWRTKLEGNFTRDRLNRMALRRAGWGVLVVWECDAERNPHRVAVRLRRLIGEGSRVPAKNLGRRKVTGTRGGGITHAGLAD
jgi:DNA mismatch endonuclease (patch repair protein)